MPGTFYASPAKGAKAFVTVGAKVDEDTDVCIVEAMKVFNTIKAEARGVIAKSWSRTASPSNSGRCCSGEAELGLGFGVQGSGWKYRSLRPEP